MDWQLVVHDSFPPVRSSPEIHRLTALLEGRWLCERVGGGGELDSQAVGLAVVTLSE